MFQCLGKLANKWLLYHPAVGSIRLTGNYSNFLSNFCQSPPITMLLLREFREVSPEQRHYIFLPPYFRNKHNKPCCVKVIARFQKIQTSLDRRKFCFSRITKEHLIY